jgi:molecular chaperone GrpE
MSKEENKMEEKTNPVENQQDSTDKNASQSAQKAAINTEKVEQESKRKSKLKKNTKEDQLQNELIESKEKLAELNDKYLRLYSEFDNFRKRTMKEKTEFFKTAGEDVIISIISIVDDFERALKITGKSEDNKAHREGLELIYSKFKKILDQKGVKEIEAIGKEFDTDMHEALTKIPAPSAELKGKVIDVIEKGYTMNDKIIRFAKVVVGD